MPKNTSNRPQAGGDNSRVDSLAPALQAVTTHQAFCPSTPQSGWIFAVQPGVPLHLALEQLMSLLATAENAATDLAICIDNDGSPNDQWAPVRLLEFALALAESIHRGLVEAQRADRSQGE